ncbi:MAG TPA: hypothetical protein VJ843_03205 [Candidatus Saccharimonadales bacterium]|nr:hypothetical protein [Candidatus Saccharimonadales bacterium]
MDSQPNPSSNLLPPRPDLAADHYEPIPVAAPPSAQPHAENPVIQMPQNPATLPPALSELAQKPLPPAESYFTPTMPSGPGVVQPTQAGPGSLPAGQLAPTPDPANFFTSDAPNGAAAQPIVLGKKSRKKWLMPAAILASLLVIGAGSAMAYYGYYVPHQPKYILARALGNTLSKDKISSARYQGSYAVATTSKGGNQTYKGTFSGYTDNKVFSMQGTVGLKVTTLKVETRAFVGDNAYIKVSGLTGLGDVLASSGLGDYSPYVTAINDNWIELDQSLLSGYSAAGAVGGIKLSAADAQRVQNMYKEHLFLQVNKVYSDQTVNGMDSYHYKVSIDHNQLYAFAKEVNSAHINGLPDLNEQTPSWMQKTDLSKYAVEVWISKDQMIINKISFSAPLGDVTVSSQVSLSDINSKTSVEKPSKSKTLLEVLSEGLQTDPQNLQKTIQQVSGLNVQTN